MTAIENVFWGVVAGVITSALLFLLGILVARVLLPWYRSLIYSGVDLQGSWVGEKIDPAGAKYRYDLTLHQNAHTVSGSGTISKTQSTSDYTQRFSVEGSTWEGFVTLTWKSSDRTRLSFAAGLLKVVDRGQVLEGYWSYRSSKSDTVHSEPIRWARTT